MTTRTALSPRAAWPMLLALTAAFAMSQAFRTVAAILAPPLQAEFGLSPEQLGRFAASFHFAFGALQLFVGIGMDLHGLRRTVLAAFPLAVAGAALSSVATGSGTLVAGQLLIGVGCAPAFLACTLFIAQNFPAQRFAMLSGLIIMLGGVGMLATGTPLAWLIEARGWRAGMAVLAACSLAAWLLVWWKVPYQPPAGGTAGAPRESPGQALRGFGALFLLPHTWGIVLMSSVNYAAFLTLRGLWLGPMLAERHGLSLLASGHVALVVSVVSLVSPPLFGRFDPPDTRRRRQRIARCTFLTAGLFAAMALLRGLAADVALALAVAAVSGYMVLQYADVRAAYPPAMIGRALSVFTMAMFMGVALMQWATGWVAARAAGWGVEPYTAVLLAIAGALLVGALGYRWLPQPASAADAAEAAPRSA
ncbi:MFS transporter [Pseudorhodoferax sp.]|uniref:MFS transporter n=1 Tax=Pseudorhodoferax sp. TaxID=1993553 RepID=UPI0039E2B308